MFQFPISGYKNTDDLLANLHSKPEQYWAKRGERMALKLFHEMATRVPAYKDFLKKHKVDPKKVKTVKDFKRVPFIDKDNYLRVFPLEQLCWDGDLAGTRQVYSSTS